MTAWLLLALVGCQEPFGSDRHTLEGFRIAGVRLEPTDDDEILEARALLVVDGRLWSADPVDFAWTWLDENEDPASWSGFGDQAGPVARLTRPARARDLLLVAVAPDGTERRAVLAVSPDPSTAPIGALAFDPAPSVEPGNTLVVSAPDAAKGPSLRWMGTVGTWFEQTPTEAEWTPDDVVLDDGEEVSREAGEEGIAPLVALRPGLDWVIRDVAVGPIPTGGALVEGRWLPGATDGLQRAILRADPDAPVGLVAESPQPVAAPLPSGPADCAGEGFNPRWLASGECTTTDFDGRSVVFEGLPWP